MYYKEYGSYYDFNSPIMTRATGFHGALTRPTVVASQHLLNKTSAKTPKLFREKGKNSRHFWSTIELRFCIIDERSTDAYNTYNPNFTRCTQLGNSFSSVIYKSSRGSHERARQLCAGEYISATRGEELMGSKQ